MQNAKINIYSKKKAKLLENKAVLKKSALIKKSKLLEILQQE